MTNAELRERIFANIENNHVGMRKVTTDVFGTVQVQDTANPLSITNTFVKVSYIDFLYVYQGRIKELKSNTVDRDVFIKGM